MRKLLIGSLLALSAAGFAQTSRSVTLTKVIDRNTTTSQATNGGTYVPGADKFISLHPTGIGVYSGTDGDFEGTMSTAGIVTTSTGFQAATATVGGQIYVVETDHNDIWRWKSISDPAPEKVYNAARKYWYGYTSTRGDDIVVGFSSPDISGNATFFSDSSPFATGSFSFAESAPIETKMGLAFNNAVDAAWTVGDTNRTYPLVKWNKVNGAWEKDTTFNQQPVDTPGIATGYYQGGPLAYDEVNNVILALSMHTFNMRIQAYDGSTGALLGYAYLTTPSFNAPRGGGGWVSSVPGSGTFYAVAKGGLKNVESVGLYKYTYTVVETSDIADWVLY